MDYIDIIPSERKIAYFTMEIALESAMPTYSGGLGVLAGDTIRSAADLKVPMVAVSLLYKKGYFHQTLNEYGEQWEHDEEWSIRDYLKKEEEIATITMGGEQVFITSWVYLVTTRSGFVLPVYFLDTDLPENSPYIRTLTDHLYGGDAHYRLSQEIVLGIGGVRILRAKGYHFLEKFHLNEGHASLLTLELLKESMEKKGRSYMNEEDIKQVRDQCVFTTHTPVPAGHDQFPLLLAKEILGEQEIFKRESLFVLNGMMNMTYMALNLSRYVNGVAKKHGETSRLMFAEYHIEAITNGVCASYWVSPFLADVFDRYIPLWREDHFSFRYALSIPRKDIWRAHQEAKKYLLETVHSMTGTLFNEDVFTICFARRATSYKRADLLFYNLERLKKIAQGKPIQVIYAGKAHPKDLEGKELIRQIFCSKEEIKIEVPVVYLQNYSMDLAKLLVAGSDLWLNNPRPPMEASGTSGMKAAMNGVPSLSVLDGWWIEGCLEGITGWGIGSVSSKNIEDHIDNMVLLDKLEEAILPKYYEDKEGWIDIMRYCIALNGSFFNTQRMVQEYVLNAYFR